MTIKELKDWLAQFPDDATVMARVIARNGRGGTFQEDLILTSSHLDEKDGEKLAYIDFGFEIGWLNAHPEFQPPTETEEEEETDPEGLS